MKANLLFLALLLISNTFFAQVPTVVAGSIIRHSNFPSSFVPSRNVDVWLPDGYSGSKKYAVLYMQDGQMLFDKTITWNKQAWDVDDVATKLLQEGKLNDFIVVGIWNNGEKRHQEYFPQKPFESLAPTEKAMISEQLMAAKRSQSIFESNADNYLRFLVKELKPFIDSAYATLPSRANTFIAGSSMGALISMYAICEYPKVFGGAACISTHWPGIFNVKNNPIPNAFLKYLQNNLPEPKTHRIYFDCGDATLDSLYPPLQKKVDLVMKLKQYNNKNWITSYFTGGVAHSEEDWNFRLHHPLLFLLGISNKPS